MRNPLQMMPRSQAMVLAFAAMLSACGAQGQSGGAPVAGSGVMGSATHALPLIERVQVQPSAWMGPAIAYQIDPAHNGYSGEPALRSPFKIAWSKQLNFYPSYPVVSNGIAYVAGINALLAVNALTGKTVWRKAAPQANAGWVGVTAGGSGYFGNEVFSLYYAVGSDPNSPALFAFDAATGAPTWSAALPGGLSFSSPPTVSNGIVYVSGDGGQAYGVRDGGELIWSQGVNGSGTVPSATTDGAYFAYACPQVYKFDLISGNLIWHYYGDCSGGGGSAAVVHDSSVYVANSLDPKYQDSVLGARRGKLKGHYASYTPPVFAQGEELLVVSAANNSEALKAIDAVTKKPLWLQQLSQGDLFAVPPIAVSGHVYALAVSGFLFDYDLKSGKELGSLNLGVSAQGYGVGPTGLGYDNGTLIVPAGSNLFGIRGS